MQQTRSVSSFAPNARFVRPGVKSSVKNSLRKSAVRTYAGVNIGDKAPDFTLKDQVSISVTWMCYNVDYVIHCA